MYQDRKDNDAALADYSKAMELDPKSVVAYRYRTYLYYKLGRGGAAPTTLTASSSSRHAQCADECLL